MSIVRCDVDNDNDYHVFISYSWAQKEIVRQIADRLKTEGFKIWIDVDQMCTYQFGLGLMHDTGHIIVILLASVCWCVCVLVRKAVGPTLRPTLHFTLEVGL